VITPITDHVAQAVAKLTTEFRKPRFAQMVASHVRPWQDLEDAAWEVYNAWDADTCDEARLNILAAIVGQPKVGATVDEFRLYVKARAAVNRSNGKTLTVVRIARALFGTVTYSFAPQTLILHTDAPDLTTARIAVGLLRDAMPVTYRLLLGFAGDGESITDTFRFSDLESIPLADESAWGDSTIANSGATYGSIL
jgi:hypothetical protein